MTLPRVFVAGALMALAACGSRVQEWPDGALEPSDYITTATTSASPEHDGGDPTSVTPAARAPRGDRTGGTAAPAAATADAAHDLLPAPAPGTYTYDVIEDGDRRPVSVTWTVARAASSVTLTATEKDNDPDYPVTEVSTYRVTASALELLDTKTLYTDEEPESCTYKPPFVVVRLPLRVGAKWTATGTCEDDESSDGAPAFEVTGTASDVVGGKALTTYVVRTKQTFDSTDDTTGERTSFSIEDVQHVDPDTLLVVREDVTFEFAGNKSTVQRHLRSLTPA